MLFGLKHALKFTATLKASVNSAVTIPKRTTLTGEVSLLENKKKKTVITETLAGKLQRRLSDFSVL